MHLLLSEIGTAKDNANSPVHNWYKFTAGFSYRFVDDIIQSESLATKKDSQIFDPFAGCGTTLVSSQKVGIPAVGNEGQEFMYDVIRAKLNWNFDRGVFENYLHAIKEEVFKGINEFDYENTPHKLLKTLYSKDGLAKLYLIKNAILSIRAWKYKLFFKLALSQTLHKVSINPIAIPYIVRSKTLSHTEETWEFFENISKAMFNDTVALNRKRKTSKIHLHDSRKPNSNIEDGECNLCITSPPYLNNLDYGEISKVHTHFFQITENWSDITKNVRHKLVTGSTTHYCEAEFSIDDYRNSEFYRTNSVVGEELIGLTNKIKTVTKGRENKKSFDILTLLYFQDMYAVLKEIRRVVKGNCNTYLIMGDSAPYGVFIPTTEYLGRISQSIGFNSFDIHRIRTRGTKWKSLKYRHNLELSENVLLIK